MLLQKEMCLAITSMHKTTSQILLYYIIYVNALNNSLYDITYDRY